MSSHTNLSNNINLDESPLPASLYNNLPHIDDMGAAAAKHQKAHHILLEMIYSHGLADCLSIHLIHKHYDIPSGRVIVYETIKGKNHLSFVLSSPRVPSHCDGLRGLFFQACPDGRMAAYEYTTDPGVDLSSHVEFVAKLSKIILDFGVENIFALTVKALGNGLLTEIEIPDLNSTILIEGCPIWLPQQEGFPTSTDWGASENILLQANISENVSEMAQPEFMDHSSNNVRNVKTVCVPTRNGLHYKIKTEKSKAKSKHITLSGVALPIDSEPYAIISQAVEVVSGY